MKKKNTTL